MGQAIKVQTILNTFKKIFNHSKVGFNFVFNATLALILVYILIQRIPDIVGHLKAQGSNAPVFEVPIVSGANFNLATFPQKVVVVFWATWCGPCQVELTRINRLIEEKSISPSSVLAVSSFEERLLLEKVAKERDYLFPIGIDINGSVAKMYKVNGTPTIVFITSEKTINWISTGLSPLLEVRIKGFLN